MREFCVKVTTLQNDDAARISRELRSVRGVAAVEVDVFSGWVVIRGHHLREDELVASVRATGLVIERIVHDPPSDP